MIGQNGHHGLNAISIHALLVQEVVQDITRTYLHVLNVHMKNNLKSVVNVTTCVINKLVGVHAEMDIHYRKVIHYKERIYSMK